jgi:dolichol-phosphate mannosyltransferase
MSTIIQGETDVSPTSVTIVVPTFNEAENVAELVGRIRKAVEGLDAEIVFVDDSTDDTPLQVTAIATTSVLPIRLIHRTGPVGGLSGAVVEGISVSQKDWCLVMDGDLQHPPELIPALIATGERTRSDIVVASRYCAGGKSGGLDNWRRRLVSSGSAAITRGMFPVRLRNCTDPMTGFFAVRRDAVQLDNLRPRGFKILLEILARHPLRVVEEPFIFGERTAGTSKASLAQGLKFLEQIAVLRFGRLSRFAVIGGIGALLNLAIMALLLSVGLTYLGAAVIAGAVTILTNFAAQELFVFGDLRHEGKPVWHRFALSVGFNTIEMLLRLPLLYLIVEFTPVGSLVAQAVTITVAFVLRFLYHSRVVYRPRRTTGISLLLPSDETTPAVMRTR